MMKPSPPPNDEERCLNGRCWTGPMMLVETDSGSIQDLRLAIKVFLMKLYRKEMADVMVRTLTLAQIPSQNTIIGFAMGREPHGAILREICALIRIHAGDTLRTKLSTYNFKLHEQEGDAYSILISHYRWMKAVDNRSAGGKPQKP